MLLVGVALLPVLALSLIPVGRRRLGAATVLGVTALGFPLLTVWLIGGSSIELIGGQGGGWIGFQLALTLVLGLGTMGALAVRVTPPWPPSLALVVAGLAGAAGTSVLVSLPVRISAGVSPWLASLWSVPVFLVWRGLGRSRGGLSYLRWFSAVWLAGTAALPFAWSARTEARMAIAESQLHRLGGEPDVYVEFLLDRFAARVDSLDRAGASDVELLYQAWRTSGLVEEGSPIFLTLWSPGDIPEQELKLGVPGPRPASVDELLPELRTVEAIEHRRLDREDALHLVSVPLGDGRLVTGVIPPRKTITTPSALGPLFASVEGADQEFLTLVPTLEGDPVTLGDPVRWSRNDEGWRGEVTVEYPDGPWSVYYTISIPDPMVMIARGTLLLSFSVGAFSVLWLLSVWLLRGRPPLPPDWRTLFTSFRGRVTWTLFGFFLLSNAIFGTVAYRTLAGASERTATALAERVVGQIAEAYLEEGGEMELLARRVGADLLEYKEGELVGGSVEELIELGLYNGWVDPEIYRALEGREDQRASMVANLGDWRYVLAFRRLPDGDIVASPVPLRAGSAALRRRDVADLLGFAAVLGPVLSLGLALLVGRALTRPIQTLQVASERVGSGNLAVHLPEDRVDEFGSVFNAFNRMVLRLGDARRELLQTTRRTEAIVEEAATGVIALDRDRRVTVVNPRAEALLDTTVPLHEGLPRDNEFARELAEWFDDYYRQGAGEADVDFEWGDRRIRGRARRIARKGRVGGVVVILEGRHRRAQERADHRVGGDGEAGRPRGEESADADQALGSAPSPRLGGRLGRVRPDPVQERRSHLWPRSTGWPRLPRASPGMRPPALRERARWGRSTSLRWSRRSWTSTRVAVSGTSESNRICPTDLPPGPQPRRRAQRGAHQRPRERADRHAGRRPDPHRGTFDRGGPGRGGRRAHRRGRRGRDPRGPPLPDLRAAVLHALHGHRPRARHRAAPRRLLGRPRWRPGVRRASAPGSRSACRGAEALALATGTPAGVRADTAGPAHGENGYRLAPRMPTNRIGRGHRPR